MNRRGLRAYVMEAKYECIRMLRVPGFAGPFLALPVALYLLFAVLLYGAAIAKDPKAGVFIFMGFATFGVMGPGMFGFGATIAMEREQGLFRLKRAMPVAPAAPLVAKMFMALVFVAVVMITMVAAAPVGHVPLNAAQLTRLCVVNVAGSLPFCALGLMIGASVSGKSAVALVNLLYLPMIYLSGILIPLPQSMHWIALLSPAYHLQQTSYWAISAPMEGLLMIHLAVLAAVTLVCTVTGVRRLSRVG